MIDASINYIISFLCRSSDAPAYVGYEADERQWGRYRVVIKPSGFFSSPSFGTPGSRPSPGLKMLGGTPILFGEPNIIYHGRTCVICADLVASAFFMLSRYEELINSSRDEHGRFLCRHSLLRDYIGRCLVDEWGDIVITELRRAGIEISGPVGGLRLLMTHDADSVTKYRTPRGAAGAILRGRVGDVLKAWRRVEDDPYFTYPFMREMELKAGIDSMLFVKVAGKTLPQDRFYYDPFSRDAAAMMSLFDSIGLHLSYEAGRDPLKTRSEIDTLERAAGRPIKAVRNHYLASLRPADMLVLEAEGISDDYTLGYADRAGFRLGTCRPVRFINPATLRLTGLTLHPLAAMDVSFAESRYMNLGYDEASACLSALKSEAAAHGGEFIMLWHNSSLSQLHGGYLRRLYLDALGLGRYDQSSSPGIV